MLDFDTQRKYHTVNKFGRAPDGVHSTSLTDIWSRADGSGGTQLVWVAPTAARLHALVSTSVNDTDAGTGAWSVKVYGLVSWSAVEVSEIVVLDGTTPVNTVNAFVIIHRMKIEGCGSAGPNAGIITATAASDGTITATILLGEGQTQMAIYGLSSQSVAYITKYDASILRSGASRAGDARLLVCPWPEVQPGVFLLKHTFGVMAAGSSSPPYQFYPYSKVQGPAIIKISALASNNGTDMSAGFDLIILPKE